MSFMPLRMRALGRGDALLVNDSGRFFAASTDLAERLVNGSLFAGDRASLAREGHFIRLGDDLGRLSHLRGLAQRLRPAGALDYLILVPTLRCNLACSYCQVSRVGERQAGFDWSDDVLAALLARIDALEAPAVKIEFQGGEPTLRPDLIQAVIDRCQRFERCQFVICTNLARVDDALLEIFDRDDVFISTSLDGDAAAHQRHRTKDEAATDRFLANLRFVVDRYGPAKVAALPTIDPAAPPDPDALIESYARFGFDSIFLRPINYQGFARKRHAHSREQGAAWRAYHSRFIRRLIELNWHDRARLLEESYFSILLRRIFRPGADRHVDLRSPNPMGMDYIVVDHDGRVYPTDEARMLARAGVIDLSIGDLFEGWDSEARERLNLHSTNQFDPACRRCAYQPYCGRDLVDDIARYGRADVPRLETDFCRRHLHLFDLAFELIYSDDPAVRHSLSRWLRLQEIPSAFGTRLS